MPPRAARMRRQGVHTACGQDGLPAVQGAPADLQLLQGAGLAAARRTQALVRLQPAVALTRRLGYVFVDLEALV